MGCTQSTSAAERRERETVAGQASANASNAVQAAVAVTTVASATPLATEIRLDAPQAPSAATSPLAAPHAHLQGPVFQSHRGSWHSGNHSITAAWIRSLREEVGIDEDPTIKAFRVLLREDENLSDLADAMIHESLQRQQTTPLGKPAVESFDEFLKLLNVIILTKAPGAYQFQHVGPGGIVYYEAAGLIGFPINAILNWPMATPSGLKFFRNSRVNQEFTKILNRWMDFLASPSSTYVLELGQGVNAIQMQMPDRDNGAAIKLHMTTVFWLGPQGKSELKSAAVSALGEGDNPTPDTFEKIFICEPGFKSWDDFFTRRFRDGVRPVSSPRDDNVIVNACESEPLNVKYNVAEKAEFMLKEQPYSLKDMLNDDVLAKKFANGTVYQAFLSALSYHRWHSPVKGKIVKVAKVSGTYFSENDSQGFAGPNGADPSAPNGSQAYLSSVATRALIFIEADNTNIGLMCFVGIGMAEVSSCDVTVEEGQHVEKGEEIGMFHFGGSTHRLVFLPGVDLVFDFHGQEPGLLATNLRVNTLLATVRPRVSSSST